jgi:hypothetical protein
VFQGTAWVSFALSLSRAPSFTESKSWSLNNGLEGLWGSGSYHPPDLSSFYCALGHLASVTLASFCALVWQVCFCLLTPTRNPLAINIPQLIPSSASHLAQMATSQEATCLSLQPSPTPACLILTPHILCCGLLPHSNYIHT